MCLAFLIRVSLPCKEFSLTAIDDKLRNPFKTLTPTTLRFILDIKYDCGKCA